MEDIDKDFALLMISRYGEDRFYHCCSRTGGEFSALILHMHLNDSERFRSHQYLLSIKIDPYLKPSDARPSETHREAICRIAYGFVRFYKEMGLRSHELPSELNARMILGEQNKWVAGYVKLINSFPNWDVDRLLPE